MDNASADILALGICQALGVTDPMSTTKYQQVYRLVYQALKKDIMVTVPTNSISVLGLPLVGPPIPLNLFPL